MIRPATFQDLASVVEIYNQAIDAGFQTAYTRRFTIQERQAWFQKHLAPAYPIFIYEEDNHVIGWLSISPYREDRPALSHSIEISYYIHASHQRKGIGTQLLAHAIPACRLLNYKVALAIIIDRNAGSLRLMENFGFARWGYLPGVAQYHGVRCGHVYCGLIL